MEVNAFLDAGVVCITSEGIIKQLGIIYITQPILMVSQIQDITNLTGILSSRLFCFQ